MQYGPCDPDIRSSFTVAPDVGRGESERMRNVGIPESQGMPLLAPNNYRGSSTVSTNQWSSVRIVTSPPYCAAMCRIDLTPNPCREESRLVVRRLPALSVRSVAS